MYRLPFVLLLAGALRAEVPCAEPGLAFPGADAAPDVRVWTLPGTDGAPPVCAGWARAERATVVRVAARFRFGGTAGDLRRRIGAVSGMSGLLYWSTTAGKWQPLLRGAWALTAAGGARRADFAPAEIASGRTLFFHQEDNRLGAAVYRMRIRSASASALVFDIENVTALKLFMLPVLAPGEAQAVYSVRRDKPGEWEYYAVSRTVGSAGALIAGHEASAINRAVALYRYLAGIPADTEPPAAR